MAALIDDACASLCDSREHDDPLVHRIWRLGSEALLMTPMPHVDLRDAYKVYLRPSATLTICCSALRS